MEGLVRLGRFRFLAIVAVSLMPRMGVATGVEAPFTDSCPFCQEKHEFEKRQLHVHNLGYLKQQRSSQLHTSIPCITVIMYGLEGIVPPRKNQQMSQPSGMQMAMAGTSTCKAASQVIPRKENAESLDLQVSWYHLHCGVGSVAWPSGGHILHCTACGVHLCSVSVTLHRCRYPPSL